MIYTFTAISWCLILSGVCTLDSMDSTLPLILMFAGLVMNIATFEYAKLLDYREAHKLHKSGTPHFYTDYYFDDVEDDDFDEDAFEEEPLQVEVKPIVEEYINEGYGEIIYLDSMR